MVAGVRKRLSNRCKTILSYSWDMTLASRHIKNRELYDAEILLESG